MQKPSDEPKKWTLKNALLISGFYGIPAVVLPIIIYKHYAGELQPTYSLENIVLAIIAGGWIILLYVNGYVKQRKDSENKDLT